MRKVIVFIFTACILTSCLTGCKKPDPDPDKEPQITFSISEADAISHNSATFNASVAANTTITDKGVCYSSQINPPTDNSKVSAGGGTGSFSAILIDLIESTVYYVRPYAVANGVTYYGKVKIFKTLLSINEQNLTISEASNITFNSATFHASVAANTTIIDKGICYSSQNNVPTTKDSKSIFGAGIGSFSMTLANLIENTVYYVRLYAIVADSTVYYGKVKSFKTLPPPTLTITNLSHNSATFHASVATNTTISDNGICYSSQNNIPTMEDIKINFGGGTGSFNVTLPNLIENTVYYVRLYAILTDGPVYYGEVKNFKTGLFHYGESVLINGVRWATRNVNTPGTFATNLEDAGMLYQWNRKIGWSSNDPLINSNGGTTWDGSTPPGTEWESANNPCPPGYHVPTEAEFQTLLNTTFVTNVWTTENGVPGRLFTDKNNGNSIFLPAAGFRLNYFSHTGALFHAGTSGYYWSSTQSGADGAYGLWFGSGSNSGSTSIEAVARSSCYSVRPVVE